MTSRSPVWRGRDSRGAIQWVMRFGPPIALVTAIVIMLAQSWARANRADGNDLTSYLLSASALLKGTNPYHTPTPFPYLYPLFLAFLLTPLSLAPHVVAFAIWFATSCAAGLASIGAMLPPAPIAEPDRRAMHGFSRVALWFVLLTPVIQSNLLNGQVNLLVLFACVQFFREEQRGRDGVAAAYLAVAISLKLTPAILGVYLLVAGKPRVLARAMLLTALCCLTPAVFTGGRIVSYYGEYLRDVLPAHLASLVSSAAQTPGPPLLEPAAQMLADHAASAWLRVILATGVMVGVIALHVRARRSASPRRETEIFALYLVAALLISPVAEPHHLALLIPGAVLTGAGDPLRLAALRGVRLSLLGFFWACLYLGAAVKHGPYTVVTSALMFLLLGLALLAPRAPGNRHPQAPARGGGDRGQRGAKLRAPERRDLLPKPHFRAARAACLSAGSRDDILPDGLVLPQVLPATAEPDVALSPPTACGAITRWW